MATKKAVKKAPRSKPSPRNLPVENVLNDLYNRFTVHVAGHAKTAELLERLVDIQASQSDHLAQIDRVLSEGVILQRRAVELLASQPQEQKVTLLKELVEAQKALAEAIAILMAKAPKPRKEKPEVTAKDITEATNAQGREIAQAQRLEQAVDTKAAPLHVVPAQPPASEGGLLDDDPTPAPAAPVPAAPAPVSNEPLDKPLTLDEVKRQFLAYTAKHKRETALALLAKYKVQLVAQVPQERWPEFYAEVCGG